MKALRNFPLFPSNPPLEGVEALLEKVLDINPEETTVSLQNQQVPKYLFFQDLLLH